MRNPYIYFFILVWLVSCRCDDPSNPSCRNFDPCLGLSTPVSADFDMFEVRGGGWPDLRVTTGILLSRRALKLVAKDTLDVEHQWIIGEDPRVRTGKQEIVTFSVYTDELRLKITHIVSGSPRSLCFPEDDGRDTVVKYIEVLFFDKDLPIFGKFRGGILHEASNIFDMEVAFMPETLPWVRDDRVEMYNFPDGCERVTDIYPGGSGFWIAGLYSNFEDCWGVFGGVAQLSPQADSLYIDFRYSDPDSLALNPQKFIDKKSIYIGKRIE